MTEAILKIKQEIESEFDGEGQTWGGRAENSNVSFTLCNYNPQSFTLFFLIFLLELILLASPRC